MIKPPKFLGKVVYFCGYPIFRKLIKGTTRAYVIVRVGDEILATKNWLGFQKKWRLPGGGLHDGEDPKIAAIRELREEIGLVIDGSLLQQVGAGPLISEFKYSYYLYEIVLPEKPHITIDEREILSAEFMQINTTKHTLSEEIKQYRNLAKN